MIAEASKEHAPAVDRPARKTVLVIEDDAAFRELLALHLSSAGYKVLVAEDAVVGGRTLLASRPDLLLLDILLPYMGGMDLLAAMRGDHMVADTPVVCVTSMRDDATFTKAMELGAAAVLTKPLRGEELLAEVARVLRGPRKETGRDAEK